jgi:ABC-type sulfate/molybdate transport systems ATPase subunit
MLELRQALRSLGRAPLLSAVDVTCTREAPTSLLGLSPAGRDMVVRLLSGTEKLQGGDIRLDSRDISLARKGKGRVLRVGPEGHPKSGAKVGKAIDARHAARVGLSDRMSATITSLDTEGRVRLALAKALQARPTMLLLDAPASGLAPEARERFATGLGQMVAECGAVVVLVAGGADEAWGLGGNAIVLADGQVQQSGSAADVFGRPANLASALATAWPALNAVSMTMDGGRGRLADGSSLHPPEGLVLPPAGACVLAFRADDSTLARETPGCVRFVVRAVGAETVAGRTYERLSFGGAAWLSPLTASEPPPGAVLNLFVDRSKVLVFGGDGRAIPQPATHRGAAAI